MNHLGDTNKMVGEDHIRDATKMVSDTPRTDEAYFKNSATMYDMAGEMKRMERELNAASKERDDALMMLGMYRMKSDEQNQRIKRLEEAGDFLSRYLREMPYASDYLAQVDERILRISNWRRAKEDNL